MRRMKRSWIVDALSALAYAEVDELELLLKLGDGHAVVDNGDDSFESGLLDCYLWGPKWLLLLCIPFRLRRGGGGREGSIFRRFLRTSLTTVGV